MDMTIPALPADTLLKLEGRIRAMTEASNDKVGIAHFYMEDALITDMKRLWVRGREAIEKYWSDMPVFQEWQLQVLETGGNFDTPYQRLRSIAWMEVDGIQHVEMGHCLIVWKKQANGEYLIYMDMYNQLVCDGPIPVYPWNKK
ncbi:MAG: YybH family protein [Burkholderiales bacterium]